MPRNLRENKNIPLLIRKLRTLYRDANCALTHQGPFQLLVSTILSAQCTDARVNRVTPDLFKNYPTPQKMSVASQEEVENLIRSTGFFRNKAKNIRMMSQLLMRKFEGQVPNQMEQLLQLPGVARKTANVVLGTAFGKSEGVVVDTHVWRLSNRLGLSRSNTPEKIEQDLMAKIARKYWIWISHALIIHGRTVCTARSPRCGECPARNECANPEL